MSGRMWYEHRTHKYNVYLSPTTIYIFFLSILCMEWSARIYAMGCDGLLRGWRIKFFLYVILPPSSIHHICLELNINHHPSFIHIYIYMGLETSDMEFFLTFLPYMWIPYTNITNDNNTLLVVRVHMIYLCIILRGFVLQYFFVIEGVWDALPVQKNIILKGRMFVIHKIQEHYSCSLVLVKYNVVCCYPNVELFANC